MLKRAQKHQGLFEAKYPTEFKNTTEALLYFVRERERARLWRVEKKPNTLEPIIREYRFCNICREADTTTQFISERIRKPYAAHPHLWFMLVIGRWINLKETLQECINGFDAWPDKPHFKCRAIAGVLDRRMRSGLTAFNAAYKIPALSKPGSKPMIIANDVFAPVWRDRKTFAAHFEGEPTLEATHELLCEYEGFGNFMAYQILTDMRYTHLLEDASDIETWCACGPGTIRGLNRLNGRPVTAKPPQKQLQREAIALWKLLKSETKIQLDLSDAVNVACEFDKFLRTFLGEGKPKQTYKR